VGEGKTIDGVCVLLRAPDAVVCSFACDQRMMKDAEERLRSEHAVSRGGGGSAGGVRPSTAASALAGGRRR